MNTIYIVFGIFSGFILLIFIGYTALSYALINKETASLDDDQRSKCREAVKSGKARSLTCRLYSHKGRCPHQPCPTIEES